ncbi:radical SAM family heme chaperone HemW [Foetidibacter luteolus]|uniref:radical SAM family heme chaperone HemW n=1 Tax=Foetidibacter luteolus TaxID=2608880 RepID=UPI00129BAC1E|nr:radical SAM family heme chaperone HemW [Foetidibacter luteolus]
MAGIYIHIPFCRKACHYCNFHFSTGTGLMGDMLKAIVKEAGLRSQYIAEPVETVYFGGGTPSLYSADDIKLILEKLAGLFAVTHDAEITLEANPDDIDAQKLHGWKNAGINRLSIGVQSFLQSDLQWMNRAHNVQQAESSIVLAQDAGLTNITIDLIYGTPTLSDEQWKLNVEKALALGITHLSCYALTVEPKTALADMIRKNKIADVSEDKQGRHFEMLMDWLAAAGWEHYEISNFALPGHRSRHNSGYWQGKPYLGLGPSAHSFNGKARQWNVSNNPAYLKSIEENKVPFEEEILTPVQQLNEYIMTALRTAEGINLAAVETKWNGPAAAGILKGAGKFLQNDLMVLNNNNLVLTRKGKLMADGIAAELFGEE